LVIFMVTAPMLVQGVKIELPKVAAEALPVENERQILTLSVKADGGFYWNLGSELDVENQTDSAVDLAELQAKVGAVIAARGDTQVYIRADEAADYGRV
ncbi:MAG TPA: protein TolR, partial [Pseudomonas sp.]|nr:protein TolR [Pseudomonas sp.]